MKILLYIFWLVILAIQIGLSQSRFGIEMNVMLAQNKNIGMISAISSGGDIEIIILKEKDLISYGYGIRLDYRLNDHNLLKVNFGTNHSKRLYEYAIIADGPIEEDVVIREHSDQYQFFEISPSYSFRAVVNKFNFPVEMGFITRISDRTKNQKNILPVRNFNLDYFLSAGVAYKFRTNFLAGMNAVYTHSIRGYERKIPVSGSYRPKQLGLETSLVYEFGNLKKDL